MLFHKYTYLHTERDRQEMAPAGSQQLWRQTRCLPDDVAPRGEEGTRDGKEGTVTGTWTWAGTRKGTGTGMSPSAGMRAKIGTIIEIRVEYKESLVTFEGVTKVGLET